MIDENLDNFLKKSICCKYDKNDFDNQINIYINNIKI